MKFLQQHSLSITTLSPVHIGSNETYEPTNYVINHDALFQFNSEQAIQALSEPERRRLLGIVNGKPDEGMLKKVQSFFHGQRNALMAKSTHCLPVGKGVETLYQERVGKTAQQETSGRRVINKLEIERTAYNPQDNRPIFPGSSIKGAIRTALLNRVNQGHPLKKSSEKNPELQERLFQYSNDLHKDPMRLVSVSDARWQNNDLPGSEIRFAVNRKKHPVEKDGRLLQSQAEQQGLYQLLECVPALRSQTLQATMNLHSPVGLSQQANTLPAESLRWSIKDIAQACNDFYLPLLQQEINLLKQRAYADPKWLEVVEQVIETLDGSNTFLLRLGRHSGAEAVTLNGVRSIKIMQGKGNQPKYEKAAKTIWLAAEDTKSSTGMAPFGWTLVEIDAASDRGNVAELLLAPWSMSARKWLQEQQHFQQEKRAEFEDEMHKRQEQEQAQAEQEQLEKLQEAERQNRLAEMTPLQRDIQIICDSDRDPAMTLFQKLDRGEWENTEDKTQVAEKIRELWGAEKKWNPDFSGSNKQKKKQQGRCLKVQECINKT